MTYLRKYQERTRALTKQAAKKIRSNMINRLVVMMSEEVNISAWWMPMKIYELYKKWNENRDNALSQKYLIDMYYYLTSQKMIRLISDLKSVYVLPPDYVKPKQMNDLIQIHSGIEAQYPKIYSGQAEIGDVPWKLEARKYPPNLQPHIDGIIYNIEKGSDNVFYWISKLCEIERNQWIPKKEKDKFSYKYKYFGIISDILHRFIDRHREYEFVRETISALEFFFKKMGHKEQPIYLYHALLLLIRRNEIDWSSKDPGIDTPVVEVERLYRDHLVGGKMPMDEYIYDLHTKRGKRSDNSMENFALEGAYIKNENIEFLRPEYREIYVKLKQDLDLYRNRGGRLQ